MTLMHVLHVLFNFSDMSLGEFDWYHILDTVLSFKTVLVRIVFIFVIASDVIIIAHAIDEALMLVMVVLFSRGEIVTAYYTIIMSGLLMIVPLGIFVIVI